MSSPASPATAPATATVTKSFFSVFNRSAGSRISASSATKTTKESILSIILACVAIVFGFVWLKSRVGFSSSSLTTCSKNSFGVVSAIASTILVWFRDGSQKSKKIESTESTTPLRSSSGSGLILITASKPETIQNSNNNNDDDEEEEDANNENEQQQNRFGVVVKKRISKTQRRKEKRQRQKLERNNNQQCSQERDENSFVVISTSNKVENETLERAQTVCESSDSDDQIYDAEESVWLDLHQQQSPTENTTPRYAKKAEQRHLHQQQSPVSPTTSTCSSVDSLDRERFERAVSSRCGSGSFGPESTTTGVMTKNNSTEISNSEDVQQQQQQNEDREKVDDDESSSHNKTSILPPEDDSLPLFVCHIGVPGAGKSTWTELFKKRQRDELLGTSFSDSCFNVIHSDVVRAEMTGNINDQTQNDAVWVEILSRVQQSLASGKNTMLDATNVDTIRRRTFMKQLPPCRWRMKVFFVKEHVAKSRIAKDLKEKKDRSCVPDKILTFMMKKFKESLDALPEEGWRPFCEEEFFRSIREEMLNEKLLLVEEQKRRLVMSNHQHQNLQEQQQSNSTDVHEKDDAETLKNSIASTKRFEGSQDALTVDEF